MGLGRVQRAGEADIEVIESRRASTNKAQKYSKEAAGALQGGRRSTTRRLRREGENIYITIMILQPLQGCIVLDLHSAPFAFIKEKRIYRLF